MKESKRKKVMNNEIIGTLEILATKLGTTSEYLWGILLKQAPLSAATNLIQYVFIVVSCIFWIKKVKIFVNKISTKEWEECNWLWIVIVTVILAMFIMDALFSFPITFYALINPEYWALDQILSKLH